MCKGQRERNLSRGRGRENPGGRGLFHNVSWHNDEERIAKRILLQYKRFAACARLSRLSKVIAQIDGIKYRYRYFLFVFATYRREIYIVTLYIIFGSL